MLFKSNGSLRGSYPGSLRVYILKGKINFHTNEEPFQVEVAIESFCSYLDENMFTDNMFPNIRRILTHSVNWATNIGFEVPLNSNSEDSSPEGVCDSTTISRKAKASTIRRIWRILKWLLLPLARITGNQANP